MVSLWLGIEIIGISAAIAVAVAVNCLALPHILRFVINLLIAPRMGEGNVWFRVLWGLTTSHFVFSHLLPVVEWFEMQCIRQV